MEPVRLVSPVRAGSLVLFHSGITVSSAEVFARGLVANIIDKWTEENGHEVLISIFWDDTQRTVEYSDVNVARVIDSHQWSVEVY